MDKMITESYQLSDVVEKKGIFIVAGEETSAEIKSFVSNAQI